MHFARPLTAATAVVILVSAFCGAASAAPYQAVIDEFWIIKNGQEIFRDAFSDGLLPPSGPDGATTYAGDGVAGFTGESGGLLTITPSLGAASPNTAVLADRNTRALRILSPNPANPAFLGVGDAFEIHGLFNLSTLPSIVAQGFGIGLERTVAWICGLPHIRETIPYARMLNRLYP